MADIRLAIAVDSAGAIRSIKTFNDEVDKTPASANRADGAVSALRKQFDNFVSGLSIGAGIAAATKGFEMLGNAARVVFDAFGKMMGALLSYSDKIVTISQRTGLAVSSLQSFNHMAKMSGSDVEVLSKAAVKMEVAIGKGDEAFKKLGLSLKDLKSMSPDQAFAKVADSIGKIEDPMQRASAAVAIFGKSGAEMLPIFAQSMEDARKQAESFGLVLDEKMVTASEALGDSIDTMGMAFDAFLMRIAGVVAQSPALMTAIEQISLAIGGLSKTIDGNTTVLGKWVDYGLDLAADAIWTLLFAVEKAISAIGLFGGALGMAFKVAADASGLTKAIAKMKEFTEETRKAMLASSKLWAGPEGSVWGSGISSTKGGGGGSFDASTKKVEVKIAELKVPNLPGMWMDLFGGGSQGKFGTLQGGSKNYNIWGDKSKFLPPELAGNTHVGGADTIQKASFNASQALQDFANIAALSSSKLGKSIAQVFGSGSGLASGISALSKAKGLLGNLGAVGSIASAGIGIVSGIVGLFKKKPKEPPPPPPEKASAASWASFLGDQQSKGAAGVLAGVSGIKVTTPEDMAAQASIASQSFWAMFKTQGLIKAADAFRAVRDKMLETFKAAGASDSATAAMLGPMSSMVDLAGNESFRGAADGAQGFGEALASIANQQLPMSIDQFRAFEQQAVAGFEQMKQAAIAQGMSMEDAIKAAAQGSGAFLTTLKDASAKYGIELGGSQAIFDAAAGAGVAFAGDSQERLILSLNALTEALGGVPPKFEQAISNAGKSAGSDKEGMDSLADSMGRGFVDLGNMIIDGIKNLPQPQIYMDSGALVGGIAAAVDNGIGSALATALEGRNG